MATLDMKDSPDNMRPRLEVMATREHRLPVGKSCASSHS